MYGEEFQNDIDDNIDYSSDKKNINKKRKKGTNSQDQKKFILIIIALVLFLLIVFFLTRGGTNEVVQKPVEKIEIIISELELSLPLNSNEQLLAQIKNHPNSVVSWKSEDERIVKVNSTGIVSAVGVGKTNVVVSYVDSEGKTYSKKCLVSVYISGDINHELLGLNYKGNGVIMKSGDIYDLMIDYIPTDGYVEKIQYESSNPYVAYIDQSNKLIAASEGTTRITAIANNNPNLNTSINVYVSNSYLGMPLQATFPEKIEFKIELQKLLIGNSIKLEYDKTPSDADINNLIWTSSDPSIVSVDKNGYITGISEGSAQITVSSLNGVSDIMQVEIVSNLKDVSSINVDDSVINLDKNEAYTIVPRIMPLDASNKALTYSSSNPDIVDVYNNGVNATIIGKKVGTATITITSMNGKKTETYVNVK